MPQPVVKRAGACVWVRLFASSTSTAAAAAAVAATSAAWSAGCWPRAATAASQFGAVAPDLLVDRQAVLCQRTDGALDREGLCPIAFEECRRVVNETPSQLVAQLLVLGGTENQQVPSVIDEFRGRVKAFGVFTAQGDESQRSVKHALGDVVIDVVVEHEAGDHSVDCVVAEMVSNGSYVHR